MSFKNSTVLGSNPSSPIKNSTVLGSNPSSDIFVLPRFKPRFPRLCSTPFIAG